MQLLTGETDAVTPSSGDSRIASWVFHTSFCKIDRCNLEK